MTSITTSTQSYYGLKAKTNQESQKSNNPSQSRALTDFNSTENSFLKHSCSQNLVQRENNKELIQKTKWKNQKAKSKGGNKRHKHRLVKIEEPLELGSLSKPRKTQREQKSKEDETLMRENIKARGFNDSKNPRKYQCQKVEKDQESHDHKVNYAIGMKLEDILRGFVEIQNQEEKLLSEKHSSFGTNIASGVTKEKFKPQNHQNLKLEALKSCFKCKDAIPEIPFHYFIERFSELGDITTPQFITAYIYLRRAISKLKIRDPLCLHKLFSCCILAAHKFSTDTEFWYLEDWAKLSGVSLKELKEQEQVLICRVFKFKMFVSAEMFERTKKSFLAYALNCFGQETQIPN